MKDEPDIPLIRYYLVSLLHKVMQFPAKSENETFFTRSQIAMVKEAERIILGGLD